MVLMKRIEIAPPLKAHPVTKMPPAKDEHEHERTPDHAAHVQRSTIGTTQNTPNGTNDGTQQHLRGTPRPATWWHANLFDGSVVRVAKASAEFRADFRLPTSRSYHTTQKSPHEGCASSMLSTSSVTPL
jgi:hypothetical protein